MNTTLEARDTLFIGHANPEDSEFTLWVYAKLKNEGYNVECDLTCLTGGEDDYWKVLQGILDHRAHKYLLVLSRDTFTKQGIIDEWEQAKAVAKRTGIKDFIMILKIDDVSFDIRIGVNVKNHFRFDLSWAKALKYLLIKLDRDKVPRKRGSPLSINDWLRNRYSTLSGVYRKSEKFYSNWLPIGQLPGEFYAYQYSNDSQAVAMLGEIDTYPIVRHDRYLITFLEDLPIFSTTNQFEIRYSNRTTITRDSVFERDESTDFPIYDDRRKFFVRLLNDAFQKQLTKRGLSSHEMSQGKRCFYYKLDQLVNNKVHFQYEGKSTWKQLVGDYFVESKWHYGISLHTLLYPHLCYSLKAHVVFSNDGQTIWESKKKLHRARRTKGKNFFNEDWRMLMLAFLHTLADGKAISVPLTEEVKLQLPTCTMLFESELGYDEPLEHGRLVPLDYHEDGEVETDEDDTDEGKSGKTV